MWGASGAPVEICCKVDIPFGIGLVWAPGRCDEMHLGDQQDVDCQRLHCALAENGLANCRLWACASDSFVVKGFSALVSELDCLCSYGRERGPQLLIGLV